MGTWREHGGAVKCLGGFCKVGASACGFIFNLGNKKRWRDKSLVEKKMEGSQSCCFPKTCRQPPKVTKNVFELPAPKHLLTN